MRTGLATVFPLALHPSFTDLDGAELCGLGLVRIRLKNDEIRLLALFERTDAIPHSDLARRVDRYRPKRLIKRDRLISTDRRTVDVTPPRDSRAYERKRPRRRTWRVSMQSERDKVIQ